MDGDRNPFSVRSCDILGTDGDDVILRVALALLLLPLGGCGGDDTNLSNRTDPVTCGAPRLASATATPFEWLSVEGLPEGLGAAVAEVRASAGTESGDDADTILTFLQLRPHGTTELQVPIHPSFRLAGGEVTVRVYSEAASCDPVPLTITALEAAPGAMAEAVDELRATVDEILAPVDAESPGIDSDRLAADLIRSGGELPLLSIPALWTMPELERLEDLLAVDALAESSPADAEMLDAIAGRLELAERMREFHDLVGVVHQLTGELMVTVPAAETRVSRAADGTDSPFHFATLSAPSEETFVPGRSSRRRAPPSAYGTQSGSCPEDRDNLFEIAEPAKLDNLMRAQDYAARFRAGASGEEGGSASGAVFNDIGAAAGWIEYAGKAGKVAAAVWDAFSTIVLNTAEAYEGLLPGEMELTVTADPPEFEEDSEKTGRWTASATATSDGMKLTQKVVEKVMETALEKGLANASIGQELIDESAAESELGKSIREGASKQIDEQLLKKPTSEAINALLESIGADEVEGGFDIPGGCWTLGDMSASDARSVGDPGGGGEDAGDRGGAPDGSSPPPLVTGHLSGDAVAFVKSGSGAAREYEPVEAGTSRLEVRTAEGYRKSFDLGRGGLDMLTGGSGLSVATTYAFGGDQYLAHTRITVNEIAVQINPTIIRVEPGDRVPFVATVRNAVDTRVRWTSSANPLDEIVDFGDGTHEAVLIAPEKPELYPITIEVESVSRSGTRADGVPVRKATAHVQLADPVVDIQPATACLSEGDRRDFRAVVYGVENQEVRWSHSGGHGRIDQSGTFRAGSGEGTVTIEATWVEDPDVSASVDVQVGTCEASWSLQISGGPAGGDYSGKDARATITDAGLISIGLHIRDRGGCPLIGFLPEAPITVPRSARTEGEVSFILCEGGFGNAAKGTPYQLSNGTGAPFHPPPARLTLREISGEWVTGEFDGWMFESANGEERNNYDVRVHVTAEFRARVR